MVLTPRIFCIGAAHVDSKAAAAEKIVAGCSNPVKLVRSPGGVALNMALNLARLGDDVGILSLLGKDEMGRWLQSIIRSQTGLKSVFMTSGQSATAQYTAVLDVDGSLYVALADMAVYDELTPAMLAAHEESFAHSPWLAVDANLPAECIAFLGERAALRGQRILFNPVSVIKARKMKPLLAHAHIVICNKAEAAQLFDAPGDDLNSAIRQSGVPLVIVTLGGDGLYYTQADGAVSGHLPALPLPCGGNCDVTGAGDALSAYLLHGLARGMPLLQALAGAQQLARATIGDASSVLAAADPLWQTLR